MSPERDRFVQDLEATISEQTAAISEGKRQISERMAYRRSQRALSRRVLIVDDHELVRAVFARMLRGLCEPRVCASGLEALEELREREYDLVIVDLDMPEMGGEELVTRLRENSLRPRVPVILVSGIEEALPAVAQRVGAVAFFGKPLEIGDFQKRVLQLLGERT